MVKVSWYCCCIAVLSPNVDLHNAAMKDYIYSYQYKCALYTHVYVSTQYIQSTIYVHMFMYVYACDIPATIYLAILYVIELLTVLYWTITRCYVCYTRYWMFFHILTLQLR